MESQPQHLKNPAYREQGVYRVLNDYTGTSGNKLQTINEKVDLHDRKRYTVYVESIVQTTMYG